MSQLVKSYWSVNCQQSVCLVYGVPPTRFIQSKNHKKRVGQRTFFHKTKLNFGCTELFSNFLRWHTLFCDFFDLNWPTDCSVKILGFKNKFDLDGRGYLKVHFKLRGYDFFFLFPLSLRFVLLKADLKLERSDWVSLTFNGRLMAFQAAFCGSLLLVGLVLFNVWSSCWTLKRSILFLDEKV